MSECDCFNLSGQYLDQVMHRGFELVETSNDLRYSLGGTHEAQNSIKLALQRVDGVERKTLAHRHSNCNQAPRHLPTRDTHPLSSFI